MLEFIAYFVIGGLVVSTTALIGAKGHGTLAAFISQFPSMTVLVFFLMYRSGGADKVINYARSFLYFVPPWLLYIGCVVFLCQRIGIWWALGIGVAVYMVSSLVIMQFR
jgi:uncharacterized membrane protein (GlpM family)